MKLTPDCLEDCSAACCRGKKYMSLNSSEFLFIKASGARLTSVDHQPNSLGRMTFRREDDCGYLHGKLCQAKELSRPHLCESLKPGERSCLQLRAENPSHVVNLTDSDREFQRYYFGLED